LSCTTTIPAAPAYLRQYIYQLISGYFRACGSYRGFFDREMMQINKVATEPRILNDLIFWCLTPLSAIFQLYHGDKF
jgi:hypothetical protein